MKEINIIKGEGITKYINHWAISGLIKVSASK